MDKLETLLYNTIISWLNDSMENYSGPEDIEVMQRVCSKTGISERDYKYLISGNTEECSWRR